MTPTNVCMRGADARNVKQGDGQVPNALRIKVVLRLCCFYYVYTFLPGRPQVGKNVDLE